MTRKQIILPLLCLILMGIGVAYWKYPSATPTSSTSIQPASVIKQGATPTANNRLAASGRIVADENDPTRATKQHPTIAVSPPESVTLSTNMKASSWENPFSPENWKADGWTFSPQGMRTMGTGHSSATFLRPYEKLMFECDILAPTPAQGSWELRLATKNSQVIMSVIVRDGQLSVVATENGLAQVILEKPLTAPLSPKVARQIRIVATGHRIVISWDRRRFLATEQLAAQSGREIVWSIHTEGATYEIPKLRVEGD